jgi:hypothetical protein
VIDMAAAASGALWAGLGVGAAAGAHTATWGMYKDAPHEGFTWRKYGRSIALGSLLGPAAAAAAGLDPRSAAGAVVLFGLVYAVERALVEFYKTFLREEDQSKYTIPMQFAVFGRPVRGRAQRWTVAAGVAAVALALAAWTAGLDAASLPLPLVLLIGSAAGWVSAIGGAWKDAPIEGFETFKFFRSPGITATYAFLVSRLDDRMLIVALGALGFTVATIETYKTFFFPSKPRGKFANKPIVHPEWLRFRLRFVPLYVGIWAFVIGAFALALLSAGPRAEGGARAQHRAAPAPPPDAADAGDELGAPIGLAPVGEARGGEERRARFAIGRGPRRGAARRTRTEDAALRFTPFSHVRGRAAWS